ncbi:MAG: DUF1593 domain-containing protein, partial [Opitutaceae bacterium]
MRAFALFSAVLFATIHPGILPAVSADDDTRPRLLVLTDIGGDPDDQQSIVRLLVHANEFDLEGLVASASGTMGELKEKITQPHLLRDCVDAYAQVYPNLRKHAAGFPSPDTLRSRIKSGNPRRGRDAIGPGEDTDGSNWIIQCATRTDSRPLAIAVWGGQTDLAQALWRMRKDRGETDAREIRSRLRIYDINDQDRIQEWIHAEFPDLFYVLAKAPADIDKREGAYRGIYLGGDESLTSRDWIDAHVRTGHGSLGALYPLKTWTAPNPHGVMKEGDTPSWFYFLPTGLGDPAHPEWGGWGGRFLSADSRLYRDARDTVDGTTQARASVWRWRPAFQNEFAARMDWGVTAEYAHANHPPQPRLNGDASQNILHSNVTVGGVARLSAEGSVDPDGNPLRAQWWCYVEAGTYARPVPIAEAHTLNATVRV